MSLGSAWGERLIRFMCIEIDVDASGKRILIPLGKRFVKCFEKDPFSHREINTLGEIDVDVQV